MRHYPGSRVTHYRRRDNTLRIVVTISAAIGAAFHYVGFDSVTVAGDYTRILFCGKTPARVW